MINQKLFNDISGRINDIIAASPAKDIEKNVRAMMMATFSRLDLVTREEFDVQQALLANAREQIDLLRARLDKLEQDVLPDTNQQDC